MKTLYFNAARALDLKIAGKILKNGGLVAMPTETVYGLAANIFDDRAIERAFRVKGRPQDNPLIVHVASFGDIQPLVRAIPPVAEMLAERFFPGALTLIFEKSNIVSSRVSAGLSTVAVRMPAHPAALKLIQNAGCPLAAPSANLSGKPSPTTAEHVKNDLDGKIEAILDGGACAVGVESTVLDVSGDVPVLLRCGGVTEETLRDLLPDLQHHNPQNPGGSPGLRHRHYAPRAPLVLLDGSAVAVANFVRQKSRIAAVGVLCFSDEQHFYKTVPSVSFGHSRNPERSAAELFDGLRATDLLHITQLYARLPQGGGLAATLRDRLTRAASGKIVALDEDEE